MLKIGSIQTRLAVGLSLSLLVLLTAQWLVVGMSIRYLTEGYIASHLIQDSETLLAALSISNSNNISLDKSKLSQVYARPFSGQYYKLSVGKKGFRSRSLWDTDLSHSTELSSEQSAEDRLRYTKSIVAGPQEQTLLQVTSRYSKKSNSIIVTVAEDLTSIYKDITTFQIRLGIVSLIVTLLLLAVQSFIVKKNLKPLDKIRKELTELEKGIINHLHEDVPTEVLPLVRELNYQFKAFRQRLDRSRNATGNLAHALKTPLSLLSQLENNEWVQQNPAIRDTLIQSVNSIEHSINRELKRSRIAGVQLGGRHTELEPEVKSLIETLRAIYQQKALKINYAMPANALCNMDRQDFMEMLGNVLDNACKWAKHEVLLTIESGQELVFTIEDDGPGCSIEEMDKLTRRGVRLDEQEKGHGLGLSIVQGIVEEYLGKMTISCSKKMGGLCVNISIPVRITKSRLG